MNKQTAAKVLGYLDTVTNWNGYSSKQVLREIVQGNERSKYSYRLSELQKELLNLAAIAKVATEAAKELRAAVELDPEWVEPITDSAETSDLLKQLD